MSFLTIAPAEMLARASDRLRAFMARQVWSARGEPAALDSYGGPRPWMKPMASWDDVQTLRESYDDLLAHFGPRADIELPKPPPNITEGYNLSVSRHDIFYQLSVRDCGRTLADYGRLRLEDAACARGEWVPDRTHDSIQQLVRARAARWKRRVDGEIQTTERKPGKVYEADLATLTAAIDALRPNRPAPARRF